MLDLLGFSKAYILDLFTMLFHLVKFPAIGFDLLLDSCLAYCVTHKKSLHSIGLCNVDLTKIGLGFDHNLQGQTYSPFVYKAGLLG